MENKIVSIPMDPGRVLFGLSRIGYTPSSAICDIIDNSVMAKSRNIHVVIIKDNERYSESRKGNVREYFIIDDGAGMDEKQILNALELGSSEEDYVKPTLSKFGLGLKSATFSQGDELTVISGKEYLFNKYIVSLPKVREQKNYFAYKEDLFPEDDDLIKSYLKNGKGTIIKIGKVRAEGHPSIKHTVEELKNKIGVIFYYFLKDNQLDIFIDGEKIEPIDVLFTEEANLNGNLDENTWNGREVRWIEKPKELVLDSETNVKAIVEVTQLPHPPTFKIDERGGDARIRDKYLIEASNYGYFVYRNKRLIYWAETFSGMIPNNQDLYSFRGRINIDDSADDVFNIDVTKSSITLSDEAWDTLSDKSAEYKRKSIKAWGRAKNLVNEKTTQETNQQSNTIIDDLEIPETLPGIIVPSEEIIKEVTGIVEAVSKKRLEKFVKQKKEDEKIINNRETSETGTTDEGNIEIVALKGEDNPYATKIFRVPYTEDNVLWEPYYDTDNGHCVRINTAHRFSRVLFEENQNNGDLHILFELFLHQLAVSEIESLKHLKTSFKSIDTKLLENILSEYRRMTSEYIANMVRKLEQKLPPLSK